LNAHKYVEPANKSKRIKTKKNILGRAKQKIDTF
jgi:hypothetical protein